MSISDEQAKKDIEAMVRYLKIYHPENANENFAAMMLDEMQQTIRGLEQNNPEALEELYQALLKDQQNSKR